MSDKQNYEDAKEQAKEAPGEGMDAVGAEDDDVSGEKPQSERAEK